MLLCYSVAFTFKVCESNPVSLLLKDTDQLFHARLLFCDTLWFKCFSLPVELCSVAIPWEVTELCFYPVLFDVDLCVSL